MKITRFERFSTADTLERFRSRTVLRGSDVHIYEKADLALIRQIFPDSLLVPAQRYVMNDILDQILELGANFAELGVDIYSLPGAVLFWVEKNGHEIGPIPLTPPIIETTEDRVWLVADGMHRISAAHALQRPINIILVSELPKQYPYYALPTTGGWADVVRFDTLPKNFVKREYRSGNYQALYRDFNAVFEGIQVARAK